MAHNDKDIKTLLADYEIRNLIYSYPRGLDRFDRDILLNIGHEAATVDFLDMFNGTWSDYVDWLIKAHTNMLYNRHTIGCIVTDIRNDAAFSETVATANLVLTRSDGNIEERITHSRYLDTWGFQGGRWWLMKRRTLRDRRTTTIMTSEAFSSATEYVHAPDIGRSDPSYDHFAKKR